MSSTTTQVLPIDTPLFTAVPPAPRHAVTTHLPGWDLMLEFTLKKPDFFAKFKDMYPRFLLHRDIKQLNAAILKYIEADGRFLVLFPTYKLAAACRDFITNPQRPDGLDSLQASTVELRVFECKTRLYAVIFPMSEMRLVMPFWVNMGVGISSRVAEENLKHLDQLREVDARVQDSLGVESSVHHSSLQKRIAELMECAPVGPPRAARVAPDDVFLFQTGMSAVYLVHQYLLNWRSKPTKTVMFGFPFNTVPNVLKWFTPGFEWFPLGTEFDELEAFLEKEALAGTPVQELWTEYPSNPLLVSSDLTRLRQLADKYGFILLVDETISGFCNVDVLPVADIIVSSLTKAFSGYADVLGGSAVLNPSSPLYTDLKALFQTHHTETLFSLDAQVLLSNSADYLPRSTIHNRNAAGLTSYLQSLVTNPNSSVAGVYYPTTSPTLANYDAYKRPSKPDYESGYGCLFSVDFDNQDSAIAFYNNLHVHQGPHLGAHRTLAIPYVRALYGDQLEAVAKFGLRPTMIRVSVGLEELEELVRVFEWAVWKADEAKGKLLQNGSGEVTEGDVVQGGEDGVIDDKGAYLNPIVGLSSPQI